MKIKVIIPDKSLYQVWATLESDTENDCLVIQANSREHATQIAYQYWKENNDIASIFSVTEIDLITEDINHG